MFILNKKSNIIQECSNNDVIKICKKDSENFEVAETVEALRGDAEATTQGTESAEQAEEDAKAEELAEAETKAQEEANQAAQNKQDEAEQKTDEVDQETDLNSKNVADLRAIAKEKGIQGYGNMNKETLIAVIMAH